MTTPNTTAPQPPDAQPISEAAPAYTGPERRSSMRLWQEKVDRRLQAGDARMQALSDALDANTASTETIKSNTADLVEMFHSFSGAIKVLHWIGNLAKPVSAIVLAATACVGLWSSLKSGTPPTIK